MLDLQNYDVVELNTTETVETEGGLNPWFIGIAASVIANVVTTALDNADKLAQSFMDGYNTGTGKK